MTRRKVELVVLGMSIGMLAVLLFGCSESPVSPAPVSQAPTPAPTAAPLPFTAATACGAPVLSEAAIRQQIADGMRCDEPNKAIGGEYRDAVVDAQVWVAANRRDVFWPGRPDVQDSTAYGRAVAERVARATGWCAMVEPDDILHVKRGNGGTATSESFDVLVSDGTVWTPPLMVQRCRGGSGW